MWGKPRIPTLKVLSKILCPVTHCILRYKQQSNAALNRLSKNNAVRIFLFLLGNCENEALFNDKEIKILFSKKAVYLLIVCVSLQWPLPKLKVDLYTFGMQRVYIICMT